MLYLWPRNCESDEYFRGMVENGWIGRMLGCPYFALTGLTTNFRSPMGAKMRPPIYWHSVRRCGHCVAAGGIENMCFHASTGELVNLLSWIWVREAIAVGLICCIFVLRASCRAIIALGTDADGDVARCCQFALGTCRRSALLFLFRFGGWCNEKVDIRSREAEISDGCTTPRRSGGWCHAPLVHCASRAGRSTSLVVVVGCRTFLFLCPG